VTPARFRVLQSVDTLGRKHQRGYTVPTAGAWTGPTLTAASADSTTATTSLSTSLRTGDYQIGLNAFDTEGFPAQISLYRDATFQLGYTHYFDAAQRLTYRVDRTAHAIDAPDVPGAPENGTVDQEQYSYDASSSAPLLTQLNTSLPPATC
jgi:hypothetical protein